MSEEKNTPPGSEAKRQPIPAWVVYLVVAGYAPMFYALIDSYEKRDKANERTIQIQSDNLKTERENSANDRRLSEMLARMLYTAKGMEKFTYADSLLNVLRTTATDRIRSGEKGDGKERAN